MSDETQTATATDSIPDAISSAVDTEEIESMLDDDPIDAVGREVGRRVGREVGARIGRELGPAVANDIRERKSPLTILRNAARRLLTILVRTVENADVKAGISKFSDFGRSILAEDTVKDGITSVLPSGVTEATDEEADEARETQEDTEQEPDTEGGEDGDVTEEDEGEAEESGDVEQEDESAGEERDEGERDEESAGEEGEADEGGAIPDEIPADADLSADELQNLTEDTYRELLETMSYRDLQSLAKDVGVKANLSQDEMTDRIVAQFSEEGEA